MISFSKERRLGKRSMIYTMAFTASESPNRLAASIASFPESYSALSRLSQRTNLFRMFPVVTNAAGLRFMLKNDLHTALHVLNHFLKCTLTLLEMQTERIFFSATSLRKCLKQQQGLKQAEKQSL